MNMRAIQALKQNELLPVLIELQAGHMISEVLSALKVTGAQKIELLSPSFISAQIDPRVIHQLEQIAYVEVKAPHKF